MFFIYYCIYCIVLLFIFSLNIFCIIIFYFLAILLLQSALKIIQLNYNISFISVIFLVYCDIHYFYLKIKSTEILLTKKGRRRNNPSSLGNHDCDARFEEWYCKINDTLSFWVNFEAGKCHICFAVDKVSHETIPFSVILRKVKKND